ncbi:MAG: hydrogenase nickel incorporation protein HypB [Xanthomonadaceae bacterium]|jgi:hydrogenase nickel incorporation protein HypB|nr:hydrogenase nickel incorporation protein HypB [Xanthomonadaceae bacterium]
MCTVCGCASGEVRIDPDRVFADARFEPAPPAPRIARAGLVAPAHEAGRSDTHDHPPASAHRHAVAAPVADAGEDLHCLPAPRSGLSAAGIPESRLVRIEADLLAKNDAIARGNRAHFAGHRVLALNLVSSPGSGKTTLLVRTLEALRGRLPLAVIEGDQQTSNDAARIRATGVPAVQVNTGKGCHLDASMVSRAFDRLHGMQDGVLFIENVGNLVCPAGFDLGEAHKVVLASVTEGEDKPLKYPDIFAASSLMLVSKVDLLPHLDFDVDALVANARRVRPGIAVIRVSARTGEGMEAWLKWIDAARTVQGLSP